MWKLLQVSLAAWWCCIAVWTCVGGSNPSPSQSQSVGQIQLVCEVTKLGGNWVLKSFITELEYQMRNLFLVDFVYCLAWSCFGLFDLLLTGMSHENTWIGLNDRTVEEDFHWTDNMDLVRRGHMLACLSLDVSIWFVWVTYSFVRFFLLLLFSCLFWWVVCWQQKARQLHCWIFLKESKMLGQDTRQLQCLTKNCLWWDFSVLVQFNLGFLNSTALS